MSLNAYALSAGVFVRGLTNLKNQLIKAEDLCTTRGISEAEMLDAQLGAEAGTVATNAQYDLHKYTLAAHVHWAAEGAKLAIARLVGTPNAPAVNHAKCFADLFQHIDSTIVSLQNVSLSDLEAGLDRTVVIEHRHGKTRSHGGQFLLAFAIPHFLYHATAVYGILRNQGVQLRMSDFLGNWEAS